MRDATAAEGDALSDRAGDGDAACLADRLRALAGALTPKEQRVVRVLFGSAMMAGMDTVAALAGRAGVSGATVIRLTRKLGLSGYGEFQRLLLAEFEARRMSPTALAARQGAASATAGVAGAAGGAGADPLAHTRRLLVETVAASLERLSPADVAAVGQLLADPRRPLLIAGGRFTALVGQILYLHLLHLRGDVTMVPDCTLTRARLLADLRPRCVVLTYDVRRYQADTVAFARRARDAGAMVVLVTDRWGSPIASFADRVLACDSSSPMAFDSLCGVLAVSEALLALVMATRGADGIARMQAIDRSLPDFAWPGTHPDPSAPTAAGAVATPLATPPRAVTPVPKDPP